MNIPAFFIPGIDNSEEAEALYRNLAASAFANAGCPEDPTGRPYSITYETDDGLATATVGEMVHATKSVKRRRKGKTVLVEEKTRYSMKVLAILPPGEGPGGCAMVLTDGASRGWANPYLAGQPRSTTHFSG
jgi:hypothetical protein